MAGRIVKIGSPFFAIVYLLKVGYDYSDKSKIGEVIVMIKAVDVKDIAECVKVVKESFSTVADELGFTSENAPRFTAFATTEERLNWQLVREHRPMYAFFDNETMVGYYSLLLQENKECELNNLCVIPAYRHKGIGEQLLKDAFKIAEELNCNKINISINVMPCALMRVQ